MSTGPQALEGDRAIESDWSQLLVHIQKHSDSLLHEGFIESMVNVLKGSALRPSLFDFTCLVGLTQDKKFIEHICLEDSLDYGALVYQLIRHVAQFKEQPDTTELELLLGLMRQCSDNSVKR